MHVALKLEKIYITHHMQTSIVETFVTGLWPFVCYQLLRTKVGHFTSTCMHDLHYGKVTDVSIVYRFSANAQRPRWHFVYCVCSTFRIFPRNRNSLMVQAVNNKLYITRTNVYNVHSSWYYIIPFLSLWCIIKK